MKTINRILQYIRHLYFYNYNIQLNWTKRIYRKDDDLAKFYATYTLAAGITVPIIYPMYRFNVFVFNSTGININHHIELIVIAILIFGLSGFFIERKVDDISKEMKKDIYNYKRDTMIWILVLISINILLFRIK